MGPLGSRGSWGPCVLDHTQSTPKKAYDILSEGTEHTAAKPSVTTLVRCQCHVTTVTRGGLTTHGAPGQ
ncbi:unnamed protein product [Staurois parvus]|uniref:Uncharacterized protein n=1 Tax=Staurois parvus TaxID=386267 RepID=A0ABN9HE64_9NEOB|nr:unnamed protein product [Staurois parvus]